MIENIDIYTMCNHLELFQLRLDDALIRISYQIKLIMIDNTMNLITNQEKLFWDNQENQFWKTRHFPNELNQI